MKRALTVTSVAAAVFCGLVLSAGATAHGDTITVCWDGSGDYLTIQEGIDGASDGDEVVVCDGTYTGLGNKNLDFHGKPITVRSANGPDTCIIDCENDGRGFRFHTDETQASVVDGFTLANGRPFGDGGAVYCDESSPTISNCAVIGNAVSYTGGGVDCYYSAATLTNCLIAGNTADWGGGFDSYGSDVTLIGCVIVGNRALIAGGGVDVQQRAPLLIDCVITGNTALGDESSGGGGVNCGDTEASLIGCIVAGNVSDMAGGLGCAFGNPVVTNCTIVGNAAKFYGGAIGGWWGTSLSIWNCTMAGNCAGSGAAIGCDSYQQQYPSNVQATNCVFWNGGDEILNNDGSTIVIGYSDVQGGWDGEGNIDADPLFAGGPSGLWTADGVYDPETYQVTFSDSNANWATNQHIGQFLNPDTSQPLQFVIVSNTMTTITAWADWATIDAGASWVTAGSSYQLHDYDLNPLGGSPCVDAANNEAVPPEVETDILGRPRFVDDPETPDTGHGDPPIVDMGAYEYQGWVLGDLNCDGVLDFDDINPFVLALTNPAQYEAFYPYCNILRADINEDGEVDFDDINPFVALLSG